MSPRQLTSPALLPKSLSYFRGHCPRPRGWNSPTAAICLMGALRRTTPMAAHLLRRASALWALANLVQGTSWPWRSWCFFPPGGWWQQSQGSTLTCEHGRSQDPGEEQQHHAQGLTECHPGRVSTAGRRAGCTED